MVPVADAARLCGARDGLQHPLDLTIIHRHFDLHLRHELDGVLLAAIGFLVPLLPPKALDLCDGHALNPDLEQGILHFIELERFDDGFD